MKTDELRIQIIEALWEAWLKWEHKTSDGTPGEFFGYLFGHRHRPYMNGQRLTKEALTPILEAHDAQVIAEHADEAIVTRKTLGLLEQLCERTRYGLVRIVIYKHGAGEISSNGNGDWVNIASFGLHEIHHTPEAALQSLLEPEEPESVTYTLPSCCEGAPDNFTVVAGSKVFTVTRKESHAGL